MDFWPDVFCRLLAQNGFRVVRYSHKDSGYSTHFDDPYPIEDLLQDLLALVAKLASGAVHLVGHSMGGFLAQMALCRDPGLVRSATSISAGSTVTPERQAELGMSDVPEETRAVLMQSEPTGEFEQDLPGWLASWRFLNGDRPFDEGAAIRYTRSLYEGDRRNAEVAEHHVHAMATVPPDLVGQLRASDRPLLVIHGTDDPLVPIDHGEATARLAADSRFQRLEGAGHMFFDAQAWDEIGQSVVAQTKSIHVD